MLPEKKPQRQYLHHALDHIYERDSVDERGDGDSGVGVGDKGRLVYHKEDRVYADEVEDALFEVGVFDDGCQAPSEAVGRSETTQRIPFKYHFPVFVSFLPHFACLSLLLISYFPLFNRGYFGFIRV